MTRSRILNLARAAAAPSLLLLVVALSHWKILLTREYTWLDAPDIARQVLPWYQLQAREWQAGRFPLWDPYSWYGQPLVGQMQPGAMYPPNWILFALPPGEDGRIRRGALAWYLVAIHALAALFAYRLCRDLKLARAPAAFGAMFFSLGGYLGSTDWPQMLNGAVWAPLVLLFQLRVARGERPWRSAALAGFFLGVAWLAGHHQIPVFLSLAAGGVWLWILLTRPPRRRGAALIALSAALAFSTAAAQLLPAREYARRAVRWVGVEQPLTAQEKVPYLVHERFSLKASSLAGIVLPGAYEHSNPHTGAAVLVAALAALALAWRVAEVRVFFWIALGGLLLSLGSQGFLHGMLYAVVPLVEKARSPSMAVFLWHFGVSVLAAYGVARLCQEKAPRWLRAVPFLLAAVLAGAAMFLSPSKPATADAAAAAGLFALLAGATLAAWRRKAIGAGALLAALSGVSLAEISLASGNASLISRHHAGHEPLLAAHSKFTQMAGYLRGLPLPWRVHVDEGAVPFNFGAWHGVETSEGYLASLTANLYGVPFSEERTRRLAGVRYAIAGQPPPGNWSEVFEEDGLRLWEDAGALPVARTVHETVTAPTREDGLRLLSDAAFDPARQAVLTGESVALESCAGEDRIEWRARRPARLELEVEMACRGMLVVADTWFPGWKARLDGREAAIHEVYGFARGIVVPAGRHRLEMRYRPWSVTLGGALSACGCLAALALAVWRPRPRPAPPA